MKIVLRSTFHQVGVLGGGALYPQFLAQGLIHEKADVEVVSPAPELYPGCRTVESDTLVSTSRLVRATRWAMANISFVPQHRDADGVIFPGQLEPLVPTRPAPRVAVCHDLTGLFFPAVHPYLAMYYRHAYGRVLRAVDCVVAISESTRRDLLRIYRLPESKVEVIYDGFNPVAISNGTSTSPDSDQSFKARYGEYILYLGSQLPHKNLKRLIEAFSALPRSTTLSLVLVGVRDAGREPEYRALAQSLGIERRVHFLGMVSQEVLPGVLRTARLLVCPSLYEGFGMTPLEGMAAGIPVAVSRAASLPEVCGDAAVYFDPLSVGEIAEALRNLDEDRSLRQRCIRMGFEQANKFSWEKAARQFLELFARLE